MGLLRGPAVVLCPPLPPGNQPAPWLDAVLRRLDRDGVPVVHVPGPTQDRRAPDSSGPPPSSGSERTPEPAADPAADRLAVAGWVADQAIAITAARLDRPLLLVSSGPANLSLPALGFSQRAARHSVVGYVMVDGPVPTPGRATTDWPDAPVLYVRTPSAPALGWDTAHRRGWRTVVGDPADVVADHVQAWPDPPA